jgi:type IV pilus assembly protein PilO
MAAKKPGAGGGFSRLPTSQKALALLLLMVLVAIGYWAALYRPLAGDIEDAEEREIRLASEERQWVTKQATYHEDKKTLNEQRAREREQLKILPDQANMDSFLEALNGNAELAGLHLVSTVPADEEPEDFYARVPVALRLSGRYHQVAKFFYNVSRLDRIINMENISILEPEFVAGEVVVRANVLATTFRALRPDERRAAPATPSRGPAKAPAKRPPPRKAG